MKRYFFGLLIIFLLLIVPLALGLTGSIGNAKAIVNVDLSKGDVLERTVLVKNVNNVSVNIKLEATEDLEGIADIIDKEFVLKENEEKNARFKVNIPGEGILNGNIAVFFSPLEGKGAGVVLQSNLIIKATGEGSEATTKTETNEEETENNEITGSTVKIDNKENEFNFNAALVVFVLLVAIIVISGFIILMRRV
mgnify:CR=1 FL=1